MALPEPVSARGVAIRARALSHGYGKGPGAVEVLRDLELDVEPGGYIALQGPSGAGKSTLLGLLGGLERPRGGSLQIGATELANLSHDAMAGYRLTTVGFIFQQFHLIEMLSAIENVSLALSLRRVPPPERRERANRLLAAVDLAERADHRPGQLSGGERQRVGIARALANQPRLLLADEPTGSLDEVQAHRVLKLIEDLWQRSGCTLVVVTHYHAVAERARVQLRLEGGRIATERIG